MAINQELNKLQTRIGNSFLRAFFPIDYRSNQNMLKNIDTLLEREIKGLRTLSGVTSQTSQKISLALNMMNDEMEQMREANEALNNRIMSATDIMGNTSQRAEDTSNALIDMLVAGGLEALLNRRSRGGAAPKTQGGPKAPPSTPDTPDKTKAKSKFKVPKGLGFIGLGITLWSMWSELQALDPNMKKGEYRQAVAQIISRAVASAGLMWVGAVVGAIVAGAISGPGAIVGFIGGLIGGAVIDFAFGDSVDDIVNQVVDYLYTGDEEEEEAPSQEEMAAADAAIQTREAPTPPPQLEPAQQQVSEQLSAQIPLAAPIVGPTPPAPPMEQTVDAPVVYPGPVDAVDLAPFQQQESQKNAATGATNQVISRASSYVPQDTASQTEFMEEKYGSNVPAGLSTPSGQSDGNRATFNTLSDQAGGIQPGQGIGSVQVIEAYGPGRPGRPVAAIRDIAVRAAETVGMTQIKFTSGVGDYISPERRAKGQKTTKHSEGIALDVAGFESPAQRIAFMQAARQLGAGGIGAYKNGSVHIDLGPEREWDLAVGVAGLAEGGKVHPKTGGTLALIAEAGEPEYVVPQSKAIKFAHEMVATRPQIRTKKRTHYVVVPILT